MASILVINLLINGLIRRLRYPSITICPASVPVMVELCPAAIKAMANKAGANFVPNNGANNLCASFNSATPVLPDLKNTEAANTNMAALTKKAALSAMVLSIKLNFSACLMALLVLAIFLVCTNAECR